MTMNRYAYLASGQLISLLENLSKVRVIIHDRENIPDGSVIFVVNHFTRIETLLLPYHIYLLTGVPVWSLADHTLFEGMFSRIIASSGGLSTHDPDRDRLIVKSLLTGEANWIIFPEGHMVKDKGGALKPSALFSWGNGRRTPHTGAATLALRTEFYRQRLRRLAVDNPAEVERLRLLFQIDDLAPVAAKKTWIQPINITYYPLRARENALSRLADRFAIVPAILREELLTEGTMLFSGVDIDIRFGKPLEVLECLQCSSIEQDMFSTAPIDFDDRLASRKVMRQRATGLMQRFMADIYAMTTVNHDHLFASLIKAIPFRRMTEEDFRRRVFLLTVLGLEKLGVYCHSSLKVGQVALLTDDCFHKYRDFITLAEETGVARREEGLIIKDPAKFSSAREVHQARLENPIGVMANEVIPLTTLQHEVLKMAWLPGFLVRRRVVAHLENQALQEFADDYREFYRPDETKASDVGAPFLLLHRSRDLGVVLVHGFLAAPRELAELAGYLNRQGLCVYVVRLKGHGTSPDDLVTRTGRDWVESVDAGYALMNALCERVVVGGFSFGGGLVLDCAARIGGLAGVFAVCPPLRLRDISSRFVSTVTAWNGVMDWLQYEGGKKEFVTITPERPRINYSRLPVAAVVELERFMTGLEETLQNVRAPALVIQSKGDPVVDPDGSQQLFALLGSADKEYLDVDFNRHGILAGDGSEEVHRVIGTFIDGIRRMR